MKFWRKFTRRARHEFQLQVGGWRLQVGWVASKIDTFEDLECYRAARDFRKRVASMARSYPQDEKYRLVDQILRASRSVAANIAEGFGRQHPQENLQFCRQARGSLMEVLEHLNVAVDEAFMDRGLYDEMRQAWSDVRGLLGGYISYLETRTSKDRKFKT